MRTHSSCYNRSLVPIFQLEYAWAHRICNQTKSNDLFIYEDDKTEKVVVNVKQIKTTVETIQARAKAYNVPKNQKYLKKIDKDILTSMTTMVPNERVESIVKTKINDIVDYLNRINPQDRNLMTLARVAGLRDTTGLPENAKKVANAIDSKDVQAVIGDIEETAQTFATKREAEINAGLPALVMNSIPDYLAENAVDMILLPLASFGYSRDYFFLEFSNPAKRFLAPLNAALKANYAKFNTDVAALFKKEGVTAAFTAADLNALISLYQVTVYQRFLELTLKTRGLLWMSNRPIFACQLHNIVFTLWRSAQTSAIVRGFLPQPGYVERSLEGVCARSAARQAQANAQLKRQLDVMTDEEWEAYLHEDQDLAITKPDHGETIGDSVTNRVKEIRSDEGFLEDEPEQIKLQFQLLGMLEDLRILGDEMRQLTTTEGIKKRIAELEEEEKTWQMASNDAESGIARQKLDALSADPSAYLETLKQKYETKRLEYNRLVAERDVSLILGNFEAIQTEQTAKELRSLKAAPIGGRSTRATLFRRTRRVRRSGPSTKSRLRSYRKSRTGKSRKTTRY